MFWLGVRGRAKIAALDRQLAAQAEEIAGLRTAFRRLEIEMSDNLDKLVGIAKRMQGRKGGRPPALLQDEAPAPEPDTERTEQLPFSRHVVG